MTLAVVAMVSRVAMFCLPVGDWQAASRSRQAAAMRIIWIAFGMELEKLCQRAWGIRTPENRYGVTYSMLKDSLLLVVSLLFLISMLAMLSDKLRISYPIFLVIAGLGISLIPGVPQIELNPNIVFVIFL